MMNSRILAMVSRHQNTRLNHFCNLPWTGFKEEIRLVVAFTTGRARHGRRGVKAGLKAEADPQIGKTNWLQKETRIYPAMPYVAGTPRNIPRRIIANTMPEMNAKRKSRLRTKKRNINNTRRIGSKMNRTIPARAIRILGRTARFRAGE